MDTQDVAELEKLLTWIIIELDIRNPKPDFKAVRQAAENALQIAIKETINAKLQKDNLIRISKSMGQ